MTARPWARPPTADVVVVLDTETTGLPTDPDAGIVELAAVAVDLRTGRELGAFSRLVGPQGPLSDVQRSILETISQIPLDVLLTAAPAGDVRGDFLRWRARVAPEAPLTSYVVPFDAEFLRRFGIVGLPWETCLQQLAGDVCGRVRLRLVQAASLLGVDPVLPAHRALSDARTAAHVLLRLAALEYRPQHHDLARTPMSAWWSDDDDTFPLADPRGGPAFPTAAVEAVVTAARAVGVPVNPSWYVAGPPFELRDLVPDATWAAVYLRRTLRAPALRRALLHVPAGPLEGHPRAATWAAIRTTLSPSPEVPCVQL